MEKTLNDYKLYEYYVEALEKNCAKLEYDASFEEWLECAKLLREVKESNLFDKYYIKRAAEYIGLRSPKEIKDNKKQLYEDMSKYLAVTAAEIGIELDKENIKNKSH